MSPAPAEFVDTRDALAALWALGGMPAERLQHIEAAGREPVLPSSFNVATAAQSSLAAAALAAAEVAACREGSPKVQRVAVDRVHATLECLGFFQLDGRTPDAWDPLSGLYRCGDGGWVRIHANFAHHRDGALTLLGCPTGPGTPREAVQQALQSWRAPDFEAAAAHAGLVVAALRSFDQWDIHPQGLALAGAPPLRIERVGDAPPLPWPGRHPHERPLSGLRLLELTRILAGPVAGRLMAGYGADVLLVNSPRLPNIASIADTSRGKLSCHIDLGEADGRAALGSLVDSAHVFLQGYRPGALAERGFGVDALVQRRPGLVVASLSAYGDGGPWSARRGFDSLVQTATGFNVAEAAAARSDTPKALPVQILDYTAGHLLAFGMQVALWRQQNEGGSWHVRVSLAGVGQWLRTLGQDAAGLRAVAPPVAPYLQRAASGFGELVSLAHAARFEQTPAAWPRPSMPPGSHPPRWPD